MWSENDAMDEYYGLKPEFLDKLGISPPLHNAVIVKNVLLFGWIFFVLIFKQLSIFNS